MDTNLKVAAVVVTYNRLEYLKDCVKGLRSQTYKNMNIVIVNNGSTDGTKEWLGAEKDLIIINQENSGGAGGFYIGMKYMYENNYDALWMMDDDGIPSSNQLEELVRVSLKYKIDYANALVVNRDDHNTLSTGNYYNPNEYSKTEYLPNFVLPFNGTLVKRHVIREIGLIKKEMFIWGDEREYTARVKANGFKMGTVVSAIHYHPIFKGDSRNVVPFCKKWKVTFKPSPLDKIFYRNLGYIDHTYGSRTYLKYIAYYLLYH